ncbi:basement membrane proteoglycan-like [Planococcus citri]|uniref:basement membrane proteoglycan-like n=1 Tax=Planococcus citri TaxID=170843 RepID=UPI0031F7A983
MLKVKYCRTWCSLLKNGTEIFVVALLVFCMQFYQVLTTADEGPLVMFVESKFTCENGTSISGRQVCDRIGDCPNDEDELGCGHPCGPREFQCSGHGTKACIPKEFHCDGKIDCYDKTDEVGCLVVRGKGAGLSVEEKHEGESFQVSCLVYGEPIPEIVWYRNEGPVSSRCTSTRIKRKGVLTCRNIKLEDSGAYTCEGINPKKFTVYARAVRPIHTVVVRPNKHEVSCRSDEFQCNGDETKACIPKQFRCDGVIDCYDKTDEVDCSPNIHAVKKEERAIIMDEGGTFEIKCFFYGEPIPEIMWYWNGGPVPTKCSSTRVHKTGVLTCPNIKPSDEGVYSCKGIDSKKFTVYARTLDSDYSLKVHQKEPEET